MLAFRTCCSNGPHILKDTLRCVASGSPVTFHLWCNKVDLVLPREPACLFWARLSIMAQRRVESPHVQATEFQLGEAAVKIALNLQMK